MDTPLHPDARARFDELGRELLAAVTVFDQAPQRPEGFSPKVVKRAPLTDRDIVGDVLLRWHDADGTASGIGVAEIGGARTALIGEGYGKLETLSQAMARVQPLSERASVEFLLTETFKWARLRHLGKSSVECVDFVLRALAAAVAEYRILVPISDVYLESPLQLGRVRFFTFPETLLETCDKAEGAGRPGVSQTGRMRSDFQGLAVAVVEVTAEPTRAEEIALNEIETAVGVLRFFSPAIVEGNVVSRVARWGYAPARTERVFLLDRNDRFVSTSERMIDTPGRMLLSDEAQFALQPAGLARVSAILARRERSQLEMCLLTAMVTIGRAALTPDLRERLVWYCAGLESLLLRDDSEPILHNLAERLAILCYDTIEHRSGAIKDVKAAYTLRSRFVHHGHEVNEVGVVTTFARHGVRLCLRVLDRTGTVTDKQHLLANVDRAKLAGALS